MKEATPYREAMRYVSNARKTLSSSAGKNGKYYTDAKYVKMACNTAYSGMLLALDARFGISKKKKRPDVDTYRQLIKGESLKALNAFNTAYNYLHLFGGYDGDLLVDTSEIGIRHAIEVIEWTRNFTDKSKP